MASARTMIARSMVPALLLSGVTAFAQAQTDSLITAYGKAAKPQTRAELAYAIIALLGDGQYPLSHRYALRGYEAQRGLPPAVIRIKLANVLGADYSDHEGNYDSALYYYGVALEAARVLKERSFEASVTGNIGATYSAKGDYPQALRYQLSALNYREAQKDEPHILLLASGIGDTYFFMDKYGEALRYYGRAYAVLKGERTARAAALFHSMGLAYGASAEREKGESFIRAALTIDRELKDSSAMAPTLSDLAGAVNERGDRAAAAALYREALSIALSQDLKATVDIIRQNMAYNGTQHGDFAGAVQQYEATLQAARASGDVRVARYVLNNLISLSDTLRDYPAAYRYSRQLALVDDTVASAAYQGSIAEAEKKYETQRALRERDRLSYESTMQSAAHARAVRERNIAIAVGAASLAALALIFGLAWRIRAIRARAKEEQDVTRAIFEGEQNERIRIARDLHDSIGQMLSVVKMRLSAMPGLPVDEMLSNAGISGQLVDKTLDEVRAISHNLIPEELAFGIVRGLENLCRKIAAAGEVDVQLAISDEVRARKFGVPFSLSLYRIVQEVLGNMLKHSAATQIRVDMAEAAGLVILQIADNGKGFDTGAISASKGIGWKNIFARVNLLNGSVDVRSERISGTRIEITIPQ